MADLDNRMVLLTSVTAGRDQDELNTAGLLVGELAINTNDGILFAGADPSGTGDGNTAKSAGQPVHNAADVLGIKLSTASTAQAVGTGNSPAFAGATINDGNLTINNGTTSSATQGGKLILAADDGAVMGDNHRLGVIEFKGAEDTSNTLSIGARIEAIARSAWGGSDNDADLVFYTTDGTTETAALTLDADSKATFGGAVSVGGNLTFDSIALTGIQASGESFADNDVSLMTSAAILDKITAESSNTAGTVTSVTAGDGMTQSGTSTVNPTLNVVGGTGITANADEITIDSTVATLTGTQTLTNKTIDLANNTVTGSLSEFNSALQSESFASLTGSETLTNKSLTSPAITGSLSGNAFLDEDTMSSNSATKVASQQSIKAYVDSVAQGLTVKDSVVAASLGSNVTVSTLDAGQSLDSITLAAGDRVLLKDQTDASENGIYDINADGNAATRSSDYDAAGDVVNGTFVFVQEGSTNADSGWVMTTDEVVTPGTTNTAWAQFSGAGQVTAGDGLQKSGNTLNIDVSDFAGNGIEADGSENLRLDVSGLTNTLTAVAQADYLVVSDESATNDESKKITFSNFEDEIFGNITGDVTIAAGGASTIGADTVANSMLENMTRGTVKVGGTSAAPTDLDAKTSGQILVGDGTDIASVAVSGDATLASTGALTVSSIGGDSVTLGGAFTTSGAHTTTLTTTGNTAITLPTTGTLVGTTASQTLTNKSIDSDNNTITNIVNADIKSTAAIATSKLADATQIDYLALGGTITTAGAITHSGAHTIALTTTGNTTITLPVSGTLVGTTATQTLENKTISGGTF